MRSVTYLSSSANNRYHGSQVSIKCNDEYFMWINEKQENEIITSCSYGFWDINQVQDCVSKIFNF